MSMMNPWPVAAAIALLACGGSYVKGRADEHARLERAQAAASSASASASSVAVSKAADLSNDLERHLVKADADTGARVDRARASIDSLKPTTSTPAPECGPHAYVISPGYTPNDLYRAYRAGRDGVLFDKGSDGAKAGDDPAQGAGDMPAGSAAGG